MIAFADCQDVRKMTVIREINCPHVEPETE